MLNLAAPSADWFNPNLLNVVRRAWSAAMLFEAVFGCGSLNPCRLLADYLLACQPGHRRPCLRKRSEGKNHNEAMRCLKRRPSDVVYRQLIGDAVKQKAGPGGHSGAALSSRAAS
jgi:hypothetical protein